jgi:signal transduction histidine kinase
MEETGRGFERGLLAVWIGSSALFLLVLGLFAVLIFRSLSSRLTQNVLEESRADAESIARRLAPSGGEPLRVTEKTRDTELYLHSVLQERRTVEYITVTDRQGRQIFSGRAEGSRRYVDAPATGGGLEAPDGATRHVTEAERDYDIAVPIEKIGFLHVGVSKDAVEKRLETLRADLVRQTAFAGAVALAALAASDVFLWRVLRRNRRLEAVRREDRRLSELGALAAGLAHEIRNPLHAIRLNLQTLEEKLPGREAAIDLSLSEVQRLNKLVSDFLLYARPPRLVPAELALAPFLAELAALVTLEFRERGVSVQAGAAPEGTVVWDAGAMRQVLWNLLKNAAEASAQAGERIVELDAAVLPGDRIRLTIADRGPGIPQDVAAKLPSLFFTTKKAGSGLGLMVASRIVREHGGSLELTPRPGGGSIAVVGMPRRVAPPPEET